MVCLLSALQVSVDPEEKPGVDLVVIRENTECLVLPFS